MKNKSILSSVLVAVISLTALPLVQAQEHDQDRRDHDVRDDHHDHHDRQDHRGHADERGAGPQHAFHRGDRLPPEFRSNQYVVDNWREHRLSAPPRGYHWVQSGGDYMLVAIGTGVILQLLLGN